MAGRGSIRKHVGQEKSISARDRNIGSKGSIIKNGDARLKIIQKKRSNLVDARDRLAQMAKNTDARSKLLKLRQMRKGISTLSTDVIQPVGKTILKKTDRNGKISLSTNKSKSNGSPMNINMAIRKELGLMTSKKKLAAMHSAKHPARPPRNARVSLAGFRAPHIVSEPKPPYHRGFDMDPVYARAPAVIQRTIHNDIVRELPMELAYGPPPEHGMYTWVRPEAGRGAEPRKPLKVVAKAGAATVDLTAGDWGYGEGPGPARRHPDAGRSIRMSPYFVDDEPEESSPPRAKTGVHARLDTPAPPPPHSQGIFSQVKTTVVVPVGHRIVVSNLQPTVTQDDIRELFEDVGELLVSRLVRPGTAEVIYKNLKDAQKAVDTYHNRQLDGQPMKCLLVNKRPINNPTAPAVRTAKTTSSVLRTNGGIVKKSITSNKISSKLVPDISTIHKVLFHKT